MKHQTDLELSVVIPVFRSEKTLEALVAEAREVLDSVSKAYEIILVEDHGGDSSWTTIEELARASSGIVRGIKLARNFGQNNAVLCGIRFARGAHVITMDDDRQSPPEEILKLLDAQRKTGADAVYGEYSKKRQSLWRDFCGYFIWKVFQISFKSDTPLTSFRIISRNLAKKISSHDQPFIVIDGLIHWHSSFIRSVPVVHLEREKGKSGYSLFKLIRLALSIFFNYTTLPLIAVVFLGITISVVNFILGALFIIRRLFYQVPLGFTAVIVSVFFATGVLLLVLGIVAEYIRRLYVLQNGYPQTSVERTTFETS